MNESLWMYFFMIMGILGIVLINIFGNILISNEQNYYLLKEVTAGAMYDAIDQKALRVGVGWDGIYNSCENVEGPCKADPESMHCEAGIPGTIRIIKEKFVESFVRRFAESAKLNRKYRIVIHDIDECPPKVSVSLIATERFSFLRFFDVNYDSGEDITNSLTGILESPTPDYYE